MAFILLLTGPTCLGIKTLDFSSTGNNILDVLIEIKSDAKEGYRDISVISPQGIGSLTKGFFIKSHINPAFIISNILVKQGSNMYEEDLIVVTLLNIGKDSGYNSIFIEKNDELLNEESLYLNSYEEANISFRSFIIGNESYKISIKNTNRYRFMNISDNFTLNEFNINPIYIRENGSLVIDLICSIMSDTASVIIVPLSIDGSIVDKRLLHLNPNEKIHLTFELDDGAAGLHNISIGQNNFSVRIHETETTKTDFPQIPYYILIVTLICLILIILYISWR